VSVRKRNGIGNGSTLSEGGPGRTADGRAGSLRVNPEELFSQFPVPVPRTFTTGRTVTFKFKSSVVSLPSLPLPGSLGEPEF
jgi:hypothetical protein